VPNAFIFDPNRCTGCHACRLACGIENELEPEFSWRRIDTFNRTKVAGTRAYHLSLACNHCDEPACMYACPALAYSRDDVTGAVLLNEDKCIGCKYCAWACPYDSPVFVPHRGVTSKCTFCVHRLEQGLMPSCASLCPTGALDFGNVPEKELQAEIDGFPVSDLGPRIVIRPFKAGRELPVMTTPAVADPHIAPAESPTSGVSLRSEWTLMAFTSLTAVLVALVSAVLIAAVPVDPGYFVEGAALTVALGALHLGKVSRAYRVILNVKRSWMSREVVTTSGFFAISAVYLWLAPQSLPLGMLAALVGFAGLFCADQVYSVLKASPPAYRHSASVLWTGLFLTGVFASSGPLAGILGLAKGTLYVVRKLGFVSADRSARPLTSVVRLGIGLLLPLALWSTDIGRFHLHVIAVVLLGELIDRGEYYAELESESPRRQMAIDLKEHVGRAPALERVATAVGD
jgi:Fe-S-cluster-containing dehydrogenase component/DMSO reductase anchor subunit